jgi:protein-S-isoprenylcysteine O-methyltransferase Ste14
MATAAPDRADVRIRPPLLLLVCLLTGLGLHAAFPLPIVPDPLAAALGAPLVVASLALFAWAVRTMLGAGEKLPTNEPTHTIVRTGPYARTRNPIYLAFCLLQLGIALWVNAVAVLATTVVCFLVLQKAVIEREERYLASKFGPTYTAYQQAVRRWL